jgi:hypothetical protein
MTCTGSQTCPSPMPTTSGFGRWMSTKANGWRQTSAWLPCDCVWAVLVPLSQPCAQRGVHILGCSGGHALLCAKGPSTRGHNAVRDELFSMARPFDANTETEPEGLIPSHPRLRPADVLTGAFHNGRLAAVDVGVICPSAAGAGADCVVTMDQRKRERLDPFRDQLEASGVEYHPFAVSCWGRLHPAATSMLQNVAKRTARREGGASQAAVLHRLRGRITIEIMRRAALMVIQCRPQLPEVHEVSGCEAPLTVEAELRAGDPSTCVLPPYQAPLSGASMVG